MKLSVKAKMNDTFYYNRPIYIINQTNFVVTINLYSENTCEMYLPYYYKIQEINGRSCEQKVKYFIKEYKKNRVKIQGKLKK